MKQIDFDRAANALAVGHAADAATTAYGIAYFKGTVVEKNPILTDLARSVAHPYIVGGEPGAWIAAGLAVAGAKLLVLLVALLILQLGRGHVERFSSWVAFIGIVGRAAAVSNLWVILG